MAKKIVGFIKLQIPAGKANPSPPIGPALGQRGLNIMEFCKAFNAQTQSMEPGLVLPVVITAFADKSFTFVLKTPPATVLMYFTDAEADAGKGPVVALTPSLLGTVAIAVAVVATIGLGVMPGPVLDLANQASEFIR